MDTVALLTIGQTPRKDICDDLRSLLPPEVCLEEYGVLDGLDEAGARARFGYPGTGELLVSRMKNGALIRLSAPAVLQGMQSCIDRAEARGAQVLLVGCTGVFPAYRHRQPLLFPGSLQRRRTVALARGGPIGVLIPIEEQRAEIAAWWREDGAEAPLIEAADPFGSEADIAAAAVRLRRRGASLLCMDCFGYSLSVRAEAARACGLEIVLPREELIRAALRILRP